MNRNITILVVILVLVALAGYLVWLRGRFTTTEASPSPVVASPSATASPVMSATPSASATTSASPSATPRTSTSSGRTVR